MQIDITDRHAHIQDSMKEYVHKKMHKLDRFTLKVESAHVVFEIQKINHRCEIVLLGKNLRLTAEEVTTSLSASFDACVSNLQTQLARYHEKIKKHHQKRLEANAEEPLE